MSKADIAPIIAPIVVSSVIDSTVVDYSFPSDDVIVVKRVDTLRPRVVKIVDQLEDIGVVNDRLKLEGKPYYYKSIHIKAYTRTDGTAVKGSMRRIKVKVKVDKNVVVNDDINELAGAFANALIVGKKRTRNSKVKN